MNTTCWKGKGCRATRAWKEHNESGVIKDNHCGVQGLSWQWKENWKHEIYFEEISWEQHESILVICKQGA